MQINHIDQLSLYHNRLVQHPHHCWHRTDPAVYILLHSHLCEIFKLLHLGQQLIPDSGWTLHSFPAENHGLRLKGANSHSHHFTPSPHELKVTTWWSHQINPVFFTPSLENVTINTNLLLLIYHLKNSYRYDGSLAFNRQQTSNIAATNIYFSEMIYEVRWFNFHKNWLDMTSFLQVVEISFKGFTVHLLYKTDAAGIQIGKHTHTL